MGTRVMKKKKRFIYWITVGFLAVSISGLNGCGKEKAKLTSEIVWESCVETEEMATHMSNDKQMMNEEVTISSETEGEMELGDSAETTEFYENNSSATTEVTIPSEVEEIEETPESTPEPTPELTPEPTPEPTPKPKSKYQIVSEKIGLKVDQIEIDFPSVNGNYTLLFVSDMHIIKEDESIISEKLEELRVRKDIAFKTSTNMQAADTWMELASVLDVFGANGIIFGGDMVDFASLSNYQTLSEGLSQIATPYMYLRADHDLGTWYSTNFENADEALRQSQSISDYQDVFVMEYPEFYVLGWNNSTSQLTDAGLNTICSIWNNQKPIILATHVPLNSVADNSLELAASSADSSGRKKLWGSGCLYAPDSNTETFLGMVYDPNSPVKAVLSGHLHFKHTVMLDDNTIEYVFAPAFSGNIAKIIVK